MASSLNDSNRRRSGGSSNSGNSGTITPDLVRQVADRVYQLWLEDLRLQRERYRPDLGRTHQSRRGGF